MNQTGVTSTGSRRQARRKRSCMGCASVAPLRGRIGLLPLALERRGVPLAVEAGGQCDSLAHGEVRLRGVREGGGLGAAGGGEDERVLAGSAAGGWRGGLRRSGGGDGGEALGSGSRTLRCLHARV